VQSTRTDAGSGREFFFSPFKNRNRQTPDKLGTPIQAGRPRLLVYLLAVLLLVAFSSLLIESMMLKFSFLQEIYVGKRVNVEKKGIWFLKKEKN